MPSRRPSTATPPADPLADVREAWGGGVDDPAPPAVLDPVPLTPEAVHEAQRAEVVAAWHADLTSSGFLHKGGCGCRYLAGIALRAAVPVELTEDVDG